jgi:hypothetical protein
MLKLLDVTVRAITYNGRDVILPYTEYRVQYLYESLPESLQVGQNDLAICRYVAENCLPMESLFHKD